MIDRGEIVKSLVYLNWYFLQDDGTADKPLLKHGKLFVKVFHQGFHSIQKGVRK